MRMGLRVAVLGAVFVVASLPSVAADGDKSSAQRGRYLVQVSGCNDCHTPGYLFREGKVPEADWLIGEQVGWYGPWGTTYGTNLRQRLHALTEDQWVAYARQIRTRPPMPWFSLNVMSEDDLRAIYRYVRTLGTSSNAVPAAVPPGQKPATPYLDMNVVVPSANK